MGSSGDVVLYDLEKLREINPNVVYDASFNIYGHDVVALYDDEHHDSNCIVCNDYSYCCCDNSSETREISEKIESDAKVGEFSAWT